MCLLPQRRFAIPEQTRQVASAAFRMVHCVDESPMNVHTSSRRHFLKPVLMVKSADNRVRRTSLVPEDPTQRGSKGSRINAAGFGRRMKSIEADQGWLAIMIQACGPANTQIDDVRVRVCYGRDGAA